MVWAATHFLVGFSIALIACALIGVKKRRMTICVLSGLWALLPDIHHPFRELGLPGADLVYSIHGSRVADVFWFHYTLDQPPFDDGFQAQVFSLAGAMVLLAIAILVFRIQKQKLP